MVDQSTSSDTPSVDEAINRVLAAERDARETLEQCRSEATRIIADSEERARRISSRAEKRIKAAHRIADGAVERALAELRGNIENGRAGRDSNGDRDRMDRAVASLVDEIIGAGP